MYKNHSFDFKNVNTYSDLSSHTLTVQSPLHDK